MTDITARLRSHDTNPAIREAAANTIEALRDELNRVSRKLRKERTENQNLAIENVRLAAAIRKGTDND